MRTAKEMEEYLASQDASYKLDMSKYDKQHWLKMNATYAHRVLFKMRGVGRKSWLNFLAAFDLKEGVAITDA